MNIENPLAFSFILQDDLYLLNNDKAAYTNNPAPLPVAVPSTAVAEETLPLTFNYLGKHKKSFLVIAHYPGIDFMAEKHLAALESTLKRLEFTMDDVAILNKANHADVTVEQLMDFFKPQKLLVLGANALPAAMDLPALNKSQQLNGCHTLLTFSFDEMMDNTEFKKAFWEQMKQF
jgi:hypothetical protein